jgi:molybdenum cofactor cytidylyltransferase
MQVCGLLLAAGRATRFGSDKLLAPLPAATLDVPAGTPLGEAAARHLAQVLPTSVAIVRPDAPALRALFAQTGLRVVECAHAEDGMGASLACGVTATNDADAWVVALADMPWIAPATFRRVVHALQHGADIVAPVYRGARGHPVGFARRHVAALATLTGDAGARDLLRAEADAVTLIDVDDPGIVRDVDTPAALHNA